MPSYKTNKIFKDDELRNMDIIHNPDVKLFKDQYEDSYTVDNFINDKEKDILIDTIRKDILRKGILRKGILRKGILRKGIL